MTRNPDRYQSLIPSVWRVRTPDPLRLGRHGQLLTVTRASESGVGFVFASGGRGTMTHQELAMRCERMKEVEG